MTAADLTALLRADLTDAATRRVLADALEDAGTPADLEAAYAAGRDDGAEMARESGTAEAPADGWDSLLINAIGLEGAARLFGVPAEDAEDRSGRWVACCRAYEAGCQDGAEEVAAAAPE